MKDTGPDYDPDAPPVYATPAGTVRRRSRVGRSLVLLCLVLAAAAIAWVYLGSPLARQENTTARRGPPPPEVTVATVKRQEVSIRLHSVGTVQPIKSVQIMPQVEGPIMKVGFTDGQTIEAGTLLFEIDPRPYQAALTQAQGQLQADQANLQSAKRDVERTSQLAEAGFAARQVLEQQRFRVAQLEAATKTGQARIDQARVDLERTTIRAPIAGRLSAAQLTEGNIVRPGQQMALTSIMQMAPIDVQFTLPQDQLPLVQARQARGPLQVSVSISGNEAELARGTLVFIDNRVEPTTGTVAMKARFQNQDGKLWPGQFVSVALELERRADAVVVDSRAVQTGPNGRYVFVVRGDVVEGQPVKLVELQEGYGVVAEGLQGGEQVVVDGQLKVVPGSPVRIRDPQNRRAAGASEPAAATKAAAP